MALCQMYRPYRGLGSGVPSRCASASASASLARKRKVGAVGHSEAPTRARRRQLRGRIEEDDDAMSFARILESELLSYFETTENSPGGEPAAPVSQDKPNGADDDDDDVMEISLDEFLGSSAAHAVPPRAAHLESAAAEFSPEKLMVASSPERSSTPSTLTGDDDGDDMRSLACPPMDDDYVELIFSQPLVQFDPAFIEEFLSDP